MTGKREYVETFDEGPGGWLAWLDNARGAARVEIEAGSAVARGPWWIDYNHAPPGGGYLHLLWLLYTVDRPVLEPYHALAWPNRFTDGGYGTDFTHARVTVRMRGELEARGAHVMLLVQAKVGAKMVNHVLTGQPIAVGERWDTHTLTLAPDPGQWKCLGSRHDRTDDYGCADIGEVLADVNGNVIFVLYPLDVAPLRPLPKVDDAHRLRVGEDYEVDRARLPTGYVMMDEVRIEFSGKVGRGLT